MWQRLISGLAGLGFARARRRLDDEARREFAAHLELLTDRYIRSGMSPDDAHVAARRQFGNAALVREEIYRMNGIAWFDRLSQDLRYAARQLRRTPVFTIVVVATLALGIGANSAIFSLMDSIVVRRLPVERPDELVAVLGQRPGMQPASGFTNAIWEAIRDQQDVFSSVFAWSGRQPFEFAAAGPAQTVDGLVVSGSFFQTLGVTPAAGRLLTTADDRRGCPLVAVLGHGFWQAQFAGDARAVGSTVTLHRQPFQIIGVSAPRFYGMEVGKKFDVAVPLCASAAFDTRNLESRGRWWLNVAGRVKPGISAELLQSRLGLLSPGVMTAAVPAGNPDSQKRFLERRLVATSAATGLSGLRRTFGEPLKMLMAGVAIVLLIACANIASLLMARGRTREKEIAIRTALGASRGRIVVQLLTESLLLTAIGGAIGLLFAGWGARLLVSYLATGRNPVFVDAVLDGRLLAFTAAAVAVTGVLVGLLPAARATGVSVIGALKSRLLTGSGVQARFHAGKWIVAGQVALTLVLLIGGGLLLRTYVTLLALDAGFDRRNVLLISAKPPTFAADTVKIAPEARTAAYDELGRRLRMIPGVISVARAFVTPIGNDNWVTSITADTPNPPAGGDATVLFNFVGPGYFGTVRTPLVAGRDFNERDTKGAPAVAIVNESAARKFFPGMNAIGRRFRLPRQTIAVEIVGITKDSKYQTLREVTSATVFLPATQAPAGGEADELVVRTSVPPSTLLPLIRRTATEVNKDIAFTFRSLAEQVSDNVVQERVLAMLSAFFGALALLLAMIGLYGLLNYLVTQRLNEFGLRMALGAEPGSILRLMLRDVGLVLAGGVAAGLALSLPVVSLMRRMLFGLEPHDTTTIATAVFLLSTLGLIAGYLPARRATKVDPMIALRSE